MTILQSLAGFYDRLDRRGRRQGIPLVPPPGFKSVEIDFVLELAPDGRPLELKSRILPSARRGSKLIVPGTAFNPSAEKGESPWEDLSFSGRTSGRRSYVFWDKTSYVFGIAARKLSGGTAVAVEPEVSRKSRDDHAAFVAAHQLLLGSAERMEFIALLRFLERWKPEDWLAASFPNEALDKNVAFQVRHSPLRIDQIPQAQQLARSVVASRTPARHCLVSGKTSSFTSKHPQVRGVRGAQPSGAALVSYNADAFVSFGADRGETAPVSEEAAFRYGAALNWLLDPINSRAFRFAETTFLFWAEQEKEINEEAALAVEDLFSAALGEVDGDVFDTADNEEGNTAALDCLAQVDEDDHSAPEIARQPRNVRSPRNAAGGIRIDPSTRLHILGLSPNNGRIAVRLWLVDTWGNLSTNIARHKQEMRIEPSVQNSHHKVGTLLFETAALRAKENIPPRLAGELACAILTGGLYPRTLLAIIIARIRADKIINEARAGVCKAVINRAHGEEVVPVALDPANMNLAYRLGRLFALIEGAQKAALPDVEATLKDRYFGLACAAPARVFPLLHKNAVSHIASLRKKRRSGLAHWMETEIGAIWSGLPADLPKALPLEDQGRFIAGYYHQRFTKAADVPAEALAVMMDEAEDNVK